MVTPMAYERASLAGFLPARRAVRLPNGAAARPGQRAIARFTRAGPVHRQSHLDGRSGDDSVRAAVSVQTQIGDCDGWRAVAWIASRTRRLQLVRTDVGSGEIPDGCDRLQRLRLAAEERIPPRLRFRRGGGGSRLQRARLSRRSHDRRRANASVYEWDRAVSRESGTANRADQDRRVVRPDPTEALLFAPRNGDCDFRRACNF